MRKSKLLCELFILGDIKLLLKSWTTIISAIRKRHL